MNVWKYTSATKVLLLGKQDDFDCLPAELQTIFANRVKGIPFDLKTGRPIVGGDSAEILKNIEAQGWHIWPESTQASQS